MGAGNPEHRHPAPEAFFEECTPGYYNNEGQPSPAAVRNGSYGGGPIAFVKILEAWREEGGLRGVGAQAGLDNHAPTQFAKSIALLARLYMITTTRNQADPTGLDVFFRCHPPAVAAEALNSAEIALDRGLKVEIPDLTSGQDITFAMLRKAANSET